MIWFHEDIVKHSNKLLKIDMVEQLGIFFTKGLPHTTFKYLQKKFMDWQSFRLIFLIICTQ